MEGRQVEMRMPEFSDQKKFKKVMRRKATFGEVRKESGWVKQTKIVEAADRAFRF